MLVAQEPVKKPTEFLAASRQYSQALSSQGGGGCRLSAEVAAARSWFSLARKIKNGRNVNSKV